MVSKSLLDTDIMSEVMKGRDPVVASRATAYRHEFGRYSISTIVVMEIVRGYHAAKQLDRLNDFRQRLTFAEVLDFTSSIADLAGRIDADLEGAGLTIGRADSMIAATAITHDLVLVTGNTKHFERIQKLGYSLRLDNWRAT